MNAHSHRLVERLLNTIRLYENQKIVLRELEEDTVGICNALEEKDVADSCKEFLSKVNDAMYLFNEDDGRQFILKEIDHLKNRHRI